MTTGPRTRSARALLAGVLLAGLVLGSIAWDEVFAQTPWSENFDSYAAGSQMHLQGGWKGWDNNPAFGALVSSSSEPHRSAPNSVAITGLTDLVHEYSGHTSGSWVYTAWQYIPSGFTGITYFILMNQYNDLPGPKSWSVQVHFESAGSVVSDYDGARLSLIRGRWVEIRVEINLDTDTQTFYYDNTPLYTKSWRCGVLGCGPLPPSIAAVDLYANGASPVYYDDISLDHAVPTLALAKTITSGNPYSTVGGTITYSYVLTNTGNVTLFAPYGVTDDRATVTCPAGPASLAPGGTVTCTASHTVTQADLDAGSVTNTASATARDAAAGGNAVTSNPSSRTATATQSPALTIAKSALPATYSSVGQVISYSYVLTNSGNVTLSGPFTVADNRATDEACPATASLAPGASISCTASYTIGQADLDAGSVTNNATASASFGSSSVTSPPDSETVTAVQSPALTIVKTALPATYGAVDDVIDYSYLVTNSGNVTLSGLFTVADNRAPDEACPATLTLAPTASITCTASYTITQADIDAGLVTNTATATNGTVTSPPDSETVTATQATGLTLTKSITGGSPYSAVGDVILYSYDVRNTGNVTLDGPFAVLDDRSTDEACPATVSLVPGASITCTASYSVTAPDLTAGSVTNSAHATGSFSGSPVTSNTDQATAVAVCDPAVTKSADPATAQVGDTVTFTIVVSNNGPGIADNVLLIDPIPVFLDISNVAVVPAGPTIGTVGNTVTVTFGTMAAGSTFTVTITTVVNSFGAPPGGTNSATVTTTSADADPANNASSATVTLVAVGTLAAPATGFAPDRTTSLPDQPESLRYSTYGDLWLEIPALGARMPIVGVPLTEDGWDVTWLWDQAGYLNGTAFPTWTGNSVITGHVTLPSGLAGPFAQLRELRYGDRIIVHGWGMRHVYEVREVAVVRPDDPAVFRHQERSWVTLVTCQGYDERSETYRWRRVAWSVLTAAEPES